MPTPDIQDLKYGFIYVIGNPKQTHNLRWFATMIQPMIRPLSLKWVETWDYDHTFIVARRFNVGNLGKYATVQLHLNSYGHSDSYSLLAAVHAFSDCLEDVMDDSEGDVIINEGDYADRNQLPQSKWGSSTNSLPLGDVLVNYGLEESIKMPQDHTRVHRTIIHNRFNRESYNKRLPKEGTIIEENQAIESVLVPEAEKPVIQTIESWSDDYAEDYNDQDDDNTADLLDVEVEEIIEFKKIESEYERDMNDLRARIVAFIAKYHQDPQQMITTLLEGKVLLGVTPGRVLVNGDMKIVLPEYDEMEIKMPAMCRTLYILFMKQRKMGNEGIVLKNIDEFRDEIIDIYSIVKPGANEDIVTMSVNNLCDPLGDSLNQTISRINRCIKNVITDKELVKKYMIKGNRGGRYGIALEPEYIDLPRAVTA